ncbi:uncharacterized protein DNG_02438 [Cephalotrichum gorgonifer]|uniref:DAGKc domain-containing protein n=1 Tax=Cephalotrichum gorgonifer TaxID=2041049 RepID=A0AAE8MTY2_9PEZI|nr:uncharacterized protein DNG_02438 [Cephalotrichum gorgonifer]
MAPAEPKEAAAAPTETNTILVLDRTADNKGYLAAFLVEDESDKNDPYRLSLHEIASVPPALEGLVVKECPAHLHPSRPVHAVISVKSGAGLAEAAWASVVRPLLELLQGLGDVQGREAPEGYRMLVTESEDSIKEFARTHLGAASSDAQPTVILLSGDGGISDLLNGRDSDSPAPAPVVAPLPFGTGNALFHSLHKPLYASGASPLVLGLRTLWRGTPSGLPVFNARFPPGAKLVRAGVGPEGWGEEGLEDGILGAVVFSHGFHASLVWESDTPQYRAHGAARFGMVAAELLRESHAYEVVVSVRGPGSDVFRPLHRVSGEPSDGGEVSSVGYILVSLVSSLEKTFTISPRSEPLDGKLRLVHFGAVGGERTMDIMKAAYAGGKHVEMEDVGYEEIEELEVTIVGGDPRWRKVCIDGIIVDIPEGGKVRLVKADSPVSVLVQ